MDSLKRDNVRLFAVLIGGGAVVAVGALSVVQESVAKSSSMTVGSTSTDTTPSTVEATTIAAPAMRDPAALTAEEQGPAAP
jgi:small neutral amino acid transporter SnatA (MarC family)